VLFAETCTKPVVDLGVAFGFTTKEILKSLTTTYANGMFKDHLKELQNCLTGN
jgi:hypothetical protein